MRKDVAVLMVLWVMCIPYATFICASATPNKLDTLKAFLRKKILYDEYVPIDSVICWSENILPVIKTNNRNDENYFLLQLQLANAYTLRGDISLAIDRARLMYEEAKETEYEFGIAVANQAIGDAYTIANQCDKALDSYQDALKELNHLSQQHPYRIQLLLKISNALQRKGQLEKAQNKLFRNNRTMPPVFLPISKKPTMLSLTDIFQRLISRKPQHICTTWIPSTGYILKSFTVFT